MAGFALQDAVLELAEIDRWAGPFSAELKTRAIDALENGKVVYFPKLAFVIQEPERGLLSPDVADAKSKNVSLDPGSGSIKGTTAGDSERARLQAMLERFAAASTRLMGDLFPEYAAGLERARTSYRPVEIVGRSYSARKDDKLLHVDAFPSTPTHGRRILRLFSNIAPDGKKRIWRVGEPFQDFAQKLLPSLRGQSAFVSWLLAAVGATKSRRSAYDQLMLGLHDGAKSDGAYQKDSPQVEIAFPPGTTWLCYTDQVLHAALAGQFALEQTFHLDIASMHDPARSPLKVLERMTGRTLVS
jgi:3-deoxy-D-manno-oct-2-ulosonic acid (Kdo) hydroxylase